MLIPFNIGNGLVQHVTRRSFQNHGLLYDVMVSHQDTVPTTHKPKAGVPGDEEEEDEAGCPQDSLPGHRDEPASLANRNGQDP